MKKAFTLIELLIVVAIIAILAAIAVPNFLEAQVRAKGSRAKADLRTLDTGLMSYFIDYNAFPKSNNFGLAGKRFDPNEQGDETKRVLERLSTPVSYLSNGFIIDPFEARFRTGTINSTDGTFDVSDPARAYNPSTDANFPLARYYGYSTPGRNPNTNAGGNQDVDSATDKANYFFVLSSSGPLAHSYNPGGIFSPTATEAAVLNNVYNATNGTISIGGIWRVNGVSTGSGNYGGQFFDTVITAQGQ